MNNELLIQYIGRNCMLSTGSMGTAMVGKIIRIEENWIEIETKKGHELMNADYVQTIKPYKDK